MVQILSLSQIKINL